jgi:two-component system aerobic respiration control sensor histidine kinase ArcB
MEQKPRILVVEDHVISQRVAYFVLKSLNCLTDYANTGTKALELIEKNEYDLIFMDLGLPDINGLDVARAIRKLYLNTESSFRLPIVALTAHTSASYDPKTLELEIDYFLEKPLMTQNVLMVLEKFVPHKYKWILREIESNKELALNEGHNMLPNLKVVNSKN